MRIVLDTNCLLLIISKNGSYFSVFEKVRSGEIQLIITIEIVNEYEEILENFYSQEVAYFILKAILNHPNTIIVEKIYYKWNLIFMDDDDNKFVDAYIVGCGDYLVTNDKHFNVLKNTDFPVVTVIDLIEFHKII
jgi:predicted nucleic acid-binding protein